MAQAHGARRLRPQIVVHSLAALAVSAAAGLARSTRANAWFSFDQHFAHRGETTLVSVTVSFGAIGIDFTWAPASAASCPSLVRRR